MVLIKEVLSVEVRCKEMGNLFQLMEDSFMKEIGVTINQMDKELKDVLMDLLLQASL